MRTYTYTSINGKIKAKLKFNSAIYRAVKIETGDNLEFALQKNPYDEKVLTTIMYYFHLKAMEEEGKQPEYTKAEFGENLDCDEMLSIYTNLMLERTSLISAGLKKE